MATIGAMEDRMSLRKGMTENIATIEDLFDDPDDIYVYDEANETYESASYELIYAAEELLYKDRGEIMTKDFTVYTFEAEKWESGTYYWKKANGAGIYSTTKKWGAKVSFANANAPYSYGDRLVIMKVKPADKNQEYYEVYYNGRLTYDNGTVHNNANISEISSNYIKINPGQVTTTFYVDLDSEPTQNNKVYYMCDEDGNEFELELNYRDGDRYTLYKIDGTTRTKKYYTGDDYNSITFSSTAVSHGGVSYAGKAECTKRIDFKTDVCRTISHPDGTIYEAVGTNYILQYLDGEVYRVLANNKARTVKFDGSDTDNVIINVTEEILTMYAIEDDATKEDAAYSISKQFNIAFPPSSSSVELKLGVDKIGIVPLHGDAADYLSEVYGATSQPVYYTYVDDGNVNFGLDVTRSMDSVYHEMTEVLNYDSSQITAIDSIYSVFNESIPYYTTTGYPVYRKVDDNYVAVTTTTAGAATLADLRTNFPEDSGTLYIANGARYLGYSSRYGALTYGLQTEGGSKMYRRVITVPTLAQIESRLGLFYLDNGEYKCATANMMNAQRTLYIDSFGTEADASQIEAWTGLFYRDLVDGAYVYTPVTFAKSNRDVPLYYIS
jgi:hypothetical protein